MGIIIIAGVAVLLVVVFVAMWRRNHRYEEE
jgi:flagellar biosynthesis/type III secretory pathway M-ring protein FliF/YscJ